MRIMRSKQPGIFLETPERYLVIQDEEIVAVWPNDPAGRNAVAVAIYLGVEKGHETYARQVVAHAA
jgi:hypothetical protein